ncbi:MAG: GNAT family N-acetyltransferase [Deltaproteobacteria bacterium]|nr:MAG: GNAT family N-acetyltransferase [Deltaproteobacteria bacterium]
MRGRRHGICFDCRTGLVLLRPWQRLCLICFNPKNLDKEMAMENLVEILTSNYPKTVALANGTRITLRPLLKEDESALVEYFRVMPMEDRLCLKEDVTDPKVIENWIYTLDYDNLLPLIALDNGRIVGDATLHFSAIGWTQHQGELRLTTDSQYRVKGLGTLMIENLIDIATRLGLKQLSAEIPPVLDKAFYLFEKLGFKEVAVLKDFVRDKEGADSDLVLMLKTLQAA